MKSLIKDIGALTGAGILTGVGASVVSKAGGSASGLTGLSSSMGTLGTVVMAKHLVKHTKKLGKIKL